MRATRLAPLAMTLLLALGVTACGDEGQDTHGGAGHV